MSLARVETSGAEISRLSPVLEYLELLHERYRPVDDGAVATYIPELARADPDAFGICIATVDGAVYEVGDTRTPFTMQSISKPLTYGLALELAGDDAVRRTVGVEPSGDAFNEISLAPGSGRPMNPMINAGAIACAGLVAASADDAGELLVEAYGRYAGRLLDVDHAVYRSESATGHRNRAIAHLLRNFEVLRGDPEAALDLYFRQCAVSVDCHAIACIAATLANGGVSPVTGLRAVDESVVRSVLSVMTTCGMYDAAGDWLVGVGLPAKSGVAGGVIAVLPGRLGIGVFSPPLDESGNSVRGVAVCRDLSRDLGLHLVPAGERPPPSVRAAYTVGEIGSKRVRHTGQRAAIGSVARSTAVFELQGELHFGAAEALSRAVVQAGEPPDLVAVDLRRIVRVGHGGIDLLGRLADALEARGGKLVLAHAAPEIRSSPALRSAVVVEDLDRALEWCEDELLRRIGCDAGPFTVPLADHALLDGLSVADRDRLEQRLGIVTAEPGELLVRRGAHADQIFLVTSGTLSVLGDNEGSRHRLATLSAGMSFGELAYVERTARTADVRADSPVECRTLPYALLDELAVSDPVVHGRLVLNLLRVAVSWVHVVSREVAHLTR